MSALPMAAHYQHVCKFFTLSIHLYFSTAYENSFLDESGFTVLMMSRLWQH